MDMFTCNINCSDLTIVLIFFVLSLLWIRSRRPPNYPPGPTPIPLIGNGHNLFGKDPIEGFRGLRKDYGDLYSISIGKFWIVVVNGSENLREIFIKNGDKTIDRPPLFLFSLTKNQGIIAASGSAWKDQRTFALSKLRDFGFGKRSLESSIQEEIGMFLEFLKDYKENPFDISSNISTSMSNNILSITVGHRFDYDDPQFKYFVNLINESARNAALAGPANFAPILTKLPGDPFGAREIERNAEQIFEFLRCEIKEHKKTFNANNIRDFIDCYLIQIEENANINGNIYTEQQLVYVLLELFAAGMETSATAIRWALVYLINDTTIQKRMQREIDDVVGSGRLPCIADKPQLPFCEAVVIETLRLANLIPFSLPHKVSEDIHYKGFIIPKESIIMPSLDSVAHDEKLFPDSNTFNPDRFIDENGKVVGQEKILTFSIGRRVCPGESLAKMELFLYLTALIQRFEFTPPQNEGPPETQGKFTIIHSPKPFKCRAILRK